MEENKFDILKDILFNFEIEGTYFYPDGENKNNYFIAWNLVLIAVDSEYEDYEYEMLEHLMEKFSFENLIFTQIGLDYYRIIGLPEIEDYEFENSVGTLLEETNIEDAIIFLKEIKTFNYSDLIINVNNEKFDFKYIV